MKLKIPEKVKPENQRFFIITQWAYIIGASGHLIAGTRFLIFNVYEMVWFNFLFSVPVFTFSFFMNRRGRHNIAFSLGFTEILLHQALGVYFIGWDSGLQYWLIYLAGLSFFNAQWTRKVRIVYLSIVIFTFMILYLFFKDHAVYVLQKAQYNSLYLSSSISTLLLLSLLINYYVQAANRAEKSLNTANRDLYEKNIQIERALAERNRAVDSLNEELNEAAEYIRTILPQPITEGPVRTQWRFIPSTSLGGDAFGYHWLDNDHFIIYLIDVSGHGVGSALLSVSVMNALRSQSLPDTDFKDPSDVLNSLNQAFPGEENNDMFFTMWYGVYNRSTRELIFASGGHPPALLLSEASENYSSIEKLRTPNYVVGGMPEVAYQKMKHNISQGSTLYIYSDGVYEVKKPDGSMWKLNEFADYMGRLKTEKSTTPDNLDRLFNHVRDLGKVDAFEDDFTIIEVGFG